MIPVPRIVEPPTFNEDVREKGRTWLRLNPGAKRPHPYWDKCLIHLRNGFNKLCGYAAMLDPTGGTVDHFLSYKNRPDLTYEWTNYRFASGVLNSSKKNADAMILDPHEVETGWFEIELPSLQLRLTDQVPAEMRAKAEYTITRLKLRDGERVISWRQDWYAMYQEGTLSLDGLRQVAPLIAEAVDRELAKNAPQQPQHA